MEPNPKLLGRRCWPDPGRNLYPVRAMLPRKAYQEPRTKIWDCNLFLNQGATSSCVGHSYAHLLASLPYPDKTVDSADAFRIYNKAQELDSWPGTAYEGTSVAAGILAVQNLYMGVESYRSANSILDAIAVLGWLGPLVIGINWFEGFFNPVNGFLKISGSIVGGHALLMRGVDIEKNAFLLHNSWGVSWGHVGTAWISFDDFDRLLNDQGEAIVVIHKGWVERAYPSLTT